MHAKIFENLTKKAAEWRSYNFGKTHAELFGVVAEQEYMFCMAGVPRGGGWPKSRCFTERANRPQGPQSKQTKTKRRDRDTFLNKSL